MAFFFADLYPALQIYYENSGKKGKFVNRKLNLPDFTRFFSGLKSTFVHICWHE